MASRGEHFASDSVATDKRSGRKGGKGKLILAAVAILIILAAIGGTSGGNKPAPSSVGADSAASSQMPDGAQAVSQPEAAASPIDLVAGEHGDYGRDLVMSAGTEFEEHLIVYYVPGGDYSVTNAGDYRAQVSVYEGIRGTEDGWDEYTNVGDVVVLDAGQMGDITVPDGWFIEIQEPAHIVLAPKG